MNKRPWMPLYIDDYIFDTGHLTLEQHGAYQLLIMRYWRTGGLPDSDAKLADCLHISIDDWTRIRPVIAKFFQPGWKHKRIDLELQKVKEFSDRQRSNVNKRWPDKESNVVKIKK